ncbi:hypothetical protein VTN77DRAFT_9039 [Rasamsonia byssochlamydoides]|uniref:uncharacterized protein n=1 Tax=Rasamsonia byssochlamydoides TaxID=89139 RepID=UPI003742CC76
MRLFWSDDRVGAWYKTMFPQGRFEEVCYNLMCLNPLAHRYHRKAYFALKPIEISDDEKRLKVKIFWLDPSKPPTKDVGILCTPSLEGKDRGPNKAKLYDHVTDRKICSGDELLFETNDPANMPLPRMELLDMQWVLHRVAAMSGAAEPQDDYDDDMDEDGQSALLCEQDMIMEDEWASDMEDPWDTSVGKELLAASSSPPSSPLAPSSPSGLKSNLFTAQGTAEGTAETYGSDLVI